MRYSRKSRSSRGRTVKGQKTRLSRSASLGRIRRGAGLSVTESKKPVKTLAEGQTVRWTWNEETVYGTVVKALTEPFDTTTKEGKTKRWIAKAHRPIYQIMLQDGTLIFKSGKSLSKSTKKLP